MIFEKAAESDIPELTGLRLAYLKEDHGKIPPDMLNTITKNLPPFFARHLNRDLIVFVCRDAEAIVGCCFLIVTEKPASHAFPNGKTCAVLNVYTRPAYRRKGVAAALLRMLLAEAAAMRLDDVELKATQAGYPLYQSLGFEDAVSKYREMKYRSTR